MKINFKKCLALIISSIIVFSVIPGAYADNANKSYVSILENIGIIDNGYKLTDEPVTRAQFIRMIVNILCDEVSIYEGNIPFDDVSVMDENYNHIRTAYEYGIISGDGNGKFNSDSPIKYNEAVKIAVDLLGYKEYAIMMGGYPGGYTKTANDVGLTKSVANTNDLISGEAAARLIYNALHTETGNIEMKGGMQSITKGGNKLMSQTMGLYSVKGILTANEFTGLYDLDGAGISTIAIGDFEANIFNTLDAEKYIGYEVECYYRSDDYGNTALAIIPTSKNNVTEILAENFVSFTGSEMNYLESDKERRLNLDNDLIVIFNGKVKDDYSEATFDINEGYIIVIDNDNDGHADVINVLSYEDYVIAGIDSEEKIIYDSYGKTLDLSTEDASKSVVIADENGKEIPFEKLEKNQVLSVAKDDSGLYVRAILSNKSVSGKISGVSTSDGNYIISINGKEYTISDNITEAYLADYKTGENGDFLINAFGKIIYFKKGTVESVYALIINIYYDEETEKVYIKYLDHYGAIKKHTVSEKCRLNGQKITNFPSLETTLTKKQVVILKSGYNGEIQMIETEGGTVLHVISEKAQATYSRGPRWFGGKLNVGQTTPIFVYPSGDTQDEDEYFVARYSYLAQMSMFVQGFNKDKKSYLPEVLAIEKPTGTDTIQYNSTNVIVESVSIVLDYDGEVINLLEGYSFSGSPVSYKIKNKSVIDGHNLSCGDMIKVEVDIKSYITQIDKFYDAKKGSVSNSSKFVSSGLTGGFKPYVGYIYEIKDDMFGISSKNGESTYEDVTYYRFSSAPVSVCEVNGSAKVDVWTTTVDILTDYVNNNNPTKLFMYTTDGLLQQIIILK